MNTQNHYVLELSQQTLRSTEMYRPWLKNTIVILRPSDSLGSSLALPHSPCVILEEFTHIVIQQTLVSVYYVLGTL